MNPSSRSALVFSAVLHALLLGVVAFFAWRSATQRADANNLLVMEVIAPPGDAQEDSFTAPPADAPFAEPAAAEPAEAAPAEPLLRQPEIAAVAEQSFEELKDVPPAPEPEPEPAPPPEPAAEPSPKPAPTRTQTPAPKTEPAPEQPKMMTREQFLKTSGLPKQAGAPTRQTTPATTTSRSTSRAPVRIDTRASTQALEGLLASGNSARVAQMSASEQNALRAYLSQLRTHIRSAWILPDSVSEKGEWAEVFVTIEPNGRISNVRIGKHQGSKAFLDSITKAVRSARPVGPTPSGQREHARYELNLRDM